MSSQTAAANWTTEWHRTESLSSVAIQLSSMTADRGLIGRDFVLLFFQTTKSLFWRLISLITIEGVIKIINKNVFRHSGSVGGTGAMPMPTKKTCGFDDLRH